VDVDPEMAVRATSHPRKGARESASINNVSDATERKARQGKERVTEKGKTRQQ